MTDAQTSPAPETLCECFGASGLHASTHHDANDVERCDLCGCPVQPGSHGVLQAPVAAQTSPVDDLPERRKEAWERQTALFAKYRYLSLVEIMEIADEAEERAAAAEAKLATAIALLETLCGNQHPEVNAFLAQAEGGHHDPA